MLACLQEVSEQYVKLNHFKHATDDIHLIGNNDYDRGPYRIVIPAGQIHVRFNVSIMDDNVPERNETFQLFIAPGSLHDDFRLGTLDRITITIVDDDNGQFTVIVELPDT